MKPINLIPAIALLAASCDGIPPGERYIEVPAAKVERVVLLEDFTGQNCQNCPAAHRAIEKLQEQYGANLAAVSIHAGEFGIPATNTRYTGLMQPEGNVYNNRYGIDEYPMGVVDGRGPLNSDQWAKAVYDAVSKPTPLSISLAAATDGATVEIECGLLSTAELSGNLVVWITESGITARQEDKDLGRVENYTHDNVFRACVNGIDGEAVTLAPGEPLSLSYSIPLRNTATEKWVPANLAAVAFLKKGGAVEQAARANVTNQPNN